MKNPEKEIKKWWNLASEYYQIEISKDKMDDVHYGPFGSSEKKLHLLGDIKKKRILELGCGAGQVSIALAKEGGVCTGIDISEKQIAKAIKNAKSEGVNVNFVIMPFSSIKKLLKTKFDIVISVMALQYCYNLKKLFADVNNLLNANGLFIFSLEHPFYLSINPNNLKLTEKYSLEGLKKDKSDTGEYIYFHRKLSTIINFLVSSGFSLENVLEPIEKPDKIWGVGYRMALVNRLGPTIIFKSIKKK
ncbi:MAG: Methyltransferase type 11 [Candidatus Parvarchaeum acidophilus ARMAN-5]|jgi:SAM-dependent methyltransferase|uniref:Methyltransferase type 11 n=1 Tax=Candidatus Parvarchaeum acidophilus ARMAN-5 TaxID=662762 RepID=D6GWL3_PARA5|nr:MAG: Methyltransferase type 11 [Candidatus Parvarchaeum acidophilus ARMAN-5]